VGEEALASLPVRQPNGCRVSTGVAWHVLGDESKAVRRWDADGFAVCGHPLRTNVRTDVRNVSANGCSGYYHSLRATQGNAFNIFSTATFGQ
jgi:hypothetical protein